MGRTDPVQSLQQLLQASHLHNRAVPDSQDTDPVENDPETTSPASLMREPSAPLETEETAVAPEAQIQDRRERGGLSTPQMLKLMRLEMDRAQRHRYPISCLVIGLDGYDSSQQAELRRVLMPAIFHELKVATFHNDIRGLGTWSPTFQFAAFPHVEPSAVATLVTALMDRVRELEVEHEGEIYRATVSVGVAHNMQSRAMRFEDFLDDAERGLRLAQSRGGDRCEMFAGVEQSIDNIKEELHAQAEEIRAQQKSYFEEKAGLEEKWGRDLIEKLLNVFHSEADISEGTIRLEQAVLELVNTEVGSLKESSALRALAESQQQIEQLERRVAKLTTSLDVTEKELKRVAAMKNVDTGVASIYRTVQGISDDDAGAEQKREMLQDLFDANLDFRKELAAKKK